MTLPARLPDKSLWVPRFPTRLPSSSGTEEPPALELDYAFLDSMAPGGSASSGSRGNDFSSSVGITLHSLRIFSNGTSGSIAGVSLFRGSNLVESISGLSWVAGQLQEFSLSEPVGFSAAEQFSVVIHSDSNSLYSVSNSASFYPEGSPITRIRSRFSGLTAIGTYPGSTHTNLMGIGGFGYVPT